MAASDRQSDLGDLFKRESGRIVSNLVRHIGIENLDVAEDAAQDAFHRALQRWKYGTLPQRPAAWLQRVARHRAIDLLRGDSRRRQLLEQVGIEDTISRGGPRDERRMAEAQLEMMFSCCDPQLPTRSQVALILKLLCGFGVKEIANACLTSHSAMTRAIGRAKTIIKGRGKLTERTDARAMRERLPGVHTALYLLFNEGYHGSHPDFAVRRELCGEAFRLTALLLDHPIVGPSSRALAALMCFNAARLSARTDDNGQLISLAKQDRSRYDRALIVRGAELLTSTDAEAPPQSLQLQAAIAGEHCFAASYASTRWGRIVDLYEMLHAIQPSPVVALNRAVAIAQLRGAAEALQLVESLVASGELDDYPYLSATLGELYIRLGRREDATVVIEQAIALSRNPQERTAFEGLLPPNE